MNILISGAGIAGFTLAYWLKQYGFTPTIVEKYPFLRKGGYKVDVRGAAVEVARRMGIYQELTDKDVKLDRSFFITSDQKQFELEGDILGHTSSVDFDVNRWDLAQIIAKAAGEVEILYNDSIVRFEDGIVYFEKSKARKFDLVIGADGVHSTVRKLFFGDETQFLKDYGIQFCVFPIPNIFELNRAQVVYFDKGKLASAYAVDNYSFACLAFKGHIDSENLKEVFKEQFNNLGWKIPKLVDAMDESSECYFDSIAQIRMPKWSKGKVALVGDAAHAASSIGTSLAMVGAYVLASELKNRDFATAFTNYEKIMRPFVEKGQNLAESNLQILARSNSSWLLTCQLYLMKLLPGKFMHLLTKWESWQMKKASNAITLPNA